MPTSPPASASATEPSPAVWAAPRSRPRLARLWRSRYTIAGLGILGALIVLAVFADQIAPYGPNRMRPTERLQAPSAAHPFGTDDLGRDILSRPVFLARHVLPNVFAPLLVLASFTFAVSVLTEAILSFLGAGAPPSVPSWGTMVAEGRNYIEAAPWLMFFPGCCIAIVVMGLNLLGDGLRDLLDPRLRGGFRGSGVS